jgi:hypothetical protein
VKKLIIPMTDNARRFGYITWTLKMDKDIHALLNDVAKVHLFFMGNNLGEKNVDWRYRRISVGSTWTKRLASDASKYILAFTQEGDNKNKLVVECQ